MATVRNLWKFRRRNSSFKKVTCYRPQDRGSIPVRYNFLSSRYRVVFMRVKQQKREVRLSGVLPTRPMSASPARFMSKGETVAWNLLRDLNKNKTKFTRYMNLFSFCGDNYQQQSLCPRWPQLPLHPAHRPLLRWTVGIVKTVRRHLLQSRSPGLGRGYRKDALFATQPLNITCVSICVGLHNGERVKLKGVELNMCIPNRLEVLVGIYEHLDTVMNSVLVLNLKFEFRER
jgi:hypothetical protein